MDLSNTSNIYMNLIHPLGRDSPHCEAHLEASEWVGLKASQDLCAKNGKHPITGGTVCGSQSCLNLRSNKAAGVGTLHVQLGAQKIWVMPKMGWWDFLRESSSWKGLDWSRWQRVEPAGWTISSLKISRSSSKSSLNIHIWAHFSSISRWRQIRALFICVIYAYSWIGLKKWRIAAKSSWIIWFNYLTFEPLTNYCHICFNPFS